MEDNLTNTPNNGVQEDNDISLSVRMETEDYLRDKFKGTFVMEWKGENCFIDNTYNSHPGFVFKDKDEAESAVMKHDKGVYDVARNYIASLIDRKSYNSLAKRGISVEDAKAMIDSGDPDGVVDTIVKKYGVCPLLASRFGQMHMLDNGYLIYY